MILEEYINFIQTLGQVGTVHLTFDPAPSGCTMATVGSECEVHLLLKGQVDVEKEVTKIEGKISKLEAQLEKLLKTMSINNYEEKVIVDGCACMGGGVFENERIHVYTRWRK